MNKISFAVASASILLAAFSFAETPLEQRVGAIVSESGMPATPIAAPAAPPAGDGEPVMLPKESRLASLKRWFDTSKIPAPPKEDLIGLNDGRCYTTDAPNDAQRFRMYGRDLDLATRHDDGPGFPQEHRMQFQITFRRLNGAIADIWGGVHGARQTGNEWRSDAAAGEDYRIRRYDADPTHFVVKVLEKDHGHVLGMCYFFQRVSAQCTREADIYCSF